MRHVRGWVLVTAAALSVGILCGAVAKAAPPEVQKNGLAYAKGHTAGHGRPGSALLAYHNGGVMTTGATIKAIFWGNWSSPGDKISGIDTLLRRDQQHAVPALEQRVHAVGWRARLAHGGLPGLLRRSVGRRPRRIRDERRARRGPASADRVPHDGGRRTATTRCTPTSRAARRSTAPGTAGARSDRRRCSSRSSSSSTATRAATRPATGRPKSGSRGDRNVSGHELSEALTDPRGAGWFDRQGAENADKCAWTFGGNVTINNQSWKIQGNFSNNAYNAHSGYDHAGCIQTG